jgi:DNA-binding SARP family transcriptional activator
MVELRLLAGIDLHGPDGDELVDILTQPKRLALLLYLDVARPHGFHRRDRLVALLWPELDSTRSRNALSKAIHHLRRALGEDAIVTRGDEVMLDAAFVRSDVRMLDHALAIGDHEQSIQLYQGPLADGFFVDEAHDFQRWLDDERARLRNGVANAAWALAEDAKKAGKIVDATAFARSAAALNREDEPSVRRLMSFLETVGDRTGALRAYDDFADWLSTELQARPAADTQALRDRIKESGAVHLPQSAEETLQSPVATETPTHGVSAARRRSSLARVAVFGVIAIVALVAIIAGFRMDARPDSKPGVDPRRVSVLAFENRTGDPRYDAVGKMATDWISQDIAESQLVSVVDPRANATANAGLIVSGAYYRDGDRLRFQAQLSQASSGTISRVFTPVTAPLAVPTRAFDSVALQATAAIAEATDSRVAALSRREKHPPSFAAYQEYVKGVDAFGAHDDAAAYEHFMRAYKLDTTFTTALLNAGASTFHRAIGSDSVLEILETKRSSLSRFNQLWLDSFLKARENDWPAVYRLTGELARQSPGSYFPLIHASAALGIRRYTTARNTLAGIDPTRGWMRNSFDYWHVRTGAQHMLGDYEAELADTRLGEKQYPANFAVIAGKVRALAALGRDAEIDAALDAAAGMVQHETWELGTPLSIAAAEAETHGFPAIAEKARKRTVAWVGALPPKKLETEPAYGPAWYLYMAQAWPEYKARVKALRRTPPDSPLWIILDGLAHAHSGDRAAAMQADSALESISSGDGRRMHPGLALFHRARIAGLLGDRDRAISLLTDAFANRFRTNIYVHADPAFASIRTDPRYVRLMASQD